MSSKILLRRGTAAQWASANPILGSGELGVETDTLKFKIGNGTSTWTQLTSYANITPSDLTSAINGLINAAPSALDTLNELAAAINNDSSFSTTVNNLLSGKVSKSGGDTITAATASTTPLAIKGASSQTANLQEWQTSTGFTFAWVTPNGNLVSNFHNGNYYVSTYNTGSYLQTDGYSVYNIQRIATSPNLIVKGAVSQTANLQEWQDSSGSLLSKITSSGSAYFDLGGNGTTNAGNALVVGSAYGASRYGSAMLSVATVGNVGIVIRGSSTQSQNLQEWQTSSGTLLSYITSSGSVRAPYLSDINGNGSFIQMNSNGAVLVNTRSTTNIGLVVYGQPSQTADLQQWWDSSSNVLTKVDSSGAIYLINPTANNNSNDTPSPAINFQGNIWNSAYGNQNIKGAIKVAAYTGNINPTISKMSFLLATDNGTPAEVASFTNTGAFSNIGGLDAYGSSVIFRLRNTTDATTLAHTPSPKLELMGRAWNSSQGSAPTRAYLQVNANNINSDPFINRLGFFVATGNNAGGWVYGADATEYMSILGNGTVGINSTNPSATLDIRPKSASNKGLLIRGTSAYAANFIDFQDSSGNTIARIAENGQAMFPRYWDANTQGESQGARIALTAPSSSNPVAIFKAAGSQTANLQEWQDSSGTVLSKIQSNGNLTINNTTIGYQYGQIFVRGATDYGASVNVSTGYLGTAGLIVRGVASQTANLTEWQNSAGTVTARFTKDGEFSVTDAYVAYFSGASNYSATLNVQTAQPNYSGIVIRGKASQTADLQQWQDSSGTTLTKVNAYGRMTINSSTDAGGAAFYVFQPNGGYGVRIQGAGTAGAGLWIDTVAGGVGAIIRGAASQTANLQEWQNSAGTVLAKVDKDGNFNNQSSFASVLTTSVAATGGNISTTYGFYNNLSPTTNAGIAVMPWAANLPGAIVRGYTGQTANLQEWQDNAGTVKSSINASGSLELNGKDIELMNIMGAF